MDSQTEKNMTFEATNTTILACGLTGLKPLSGSTGQLITVIATTVFILAGNAINLAILGTTKSLRTAHGYLLSALAIGGFIVGCNATLSIYPVVTKCWLYGTIICQLSAYLFEFCMVFNLFIVVLLSGERYIAIVNPLKYRVLITKTKTKIAIGVSTMISCVFLTILAVTQPEFEYKPRQYVCRRTKNDDIRGAFMALSSILLIFSFAVVSYTSVTMLRAVVRRSNESKRLFEGVHASHIQSNASMVSAQNSRIFKVTVLIATTFYISWIPAIVGAILNVADPNILESSPIFEFAAQWLLISNTLFNTLIYFFMLKLFRVRAKEISAQLCCCLCFVVKGIRRADPSTNSDNRLAVELTVFPKGTTSNI
ncbi:beta-1 adrenergic receptor-like [Asterias amurensis]|uniref:beta-1 adrenergic receptor-like n=1 Tax=Asterias amurensis TaxID=7602 RepID=UPI003AB4AC9D